MVLDHGIELEAKNLKVVYEEIQKEKKNCVVKQYSWCFGNHNTGNSHYTHVTQILWLSEKKIKGFLWVVFFLMFQQGSCHLLKIFGK